MDLQIQPPWLTPYKMLSSNDVNWHVLALTLELLQEQQMTTVDEGNEEV